MFSPFKKGGGTKKVLPCVEGGGGSTIWDTQFSHFVALFLLFTSF